jgi:hypothetical protein
MIIHDENVKLVCHESFDRRFPGARPVTSIEERFVAAIQLFTYKRALSRSGMAHTASCRMR